MADEINYYSVSLFQLLVPRSIFFRNNVILYRNCFFKLRFLITSTFMFNILIDRILKYFSQQYLIKHNAICSNISCNAFLFSVTGSVYLAISFLFIQSLIFFRFISQSWSSYF